MTTCNNAIVSLKPEINGKQSQLSNMQTVKKLANKFNSCKFTMYYQKQGGPTGKSCPEAILTNKHFKNSIPDFKYFLKCLIWF